MTVKRVGVVGSGVMGTGIAEVVASAGHDVVLRSRDRASAERTLSGIACSLDTAVGKGRLEPERRDEVLRRITATDRLDELAECDIVIETVIEDLATKRRLFAELDWVLPDSSVLATNTSTLPVIELAMETKQPGRVCGLHFFNPAPLMPLVEVVRPLTALDETIDTAKRFAEACGKTAIVVKDQAGFVVNALLFPYLNHAVRLLEAGVASIEDIDTAMRGGCGFPMGPFALLDLVGIDTSLAILDALYNETRDPACAAVPRLRRMAAAGLLGRKSGAGFYSYGAGGR